jgi:hypothetical protein
MSHVKSIFEKLRVSENVNNLGDNPEGVFGVVAVDEDVDQIIKDLIDTEFSSSEEEKGKAAEMIKGLFFSEDPKAKEMIVKLDKWFSSLKGMSEVDSEDSSPLTKTMDRAMTKIGTKSIAVQSDIYKVLSNKLVSLIDENPTLKMKGRKLLLDMLNSNFKD